MHEREPQEWSSPSTFHIPPLSNSIIIIPTINKTNLQAGFFLDLIIFPSSHISFPTHGCSISHRHPNYLEVGCFTLACGRYFNAYSASNSEVLLPCFLPNICVLTFPTYSLSSLTSYSLRIPLCELHMPTNWWFERQLSMRAPLPSILYPTITGPYWHVFFGALLYTTSPQSADYQQQQAGDSFVLYHS